MKNNSLKKHSRKTLVKNSSCLNLFVLAIFFITSLTSFAQSTLYSITNGDWNNGNTWSTTSGGSACSCTPGSNDAVILESNFDVNMNVNGNANSVTINSGSTLIYTATATLNIKGAGSLTVNNGGDINDNGQTNSMIEFDDAQTCALVVNDATNGINVDIIGIRGAGTLNISGNGDITINDDFRLRAATTVNNDLTGTFSIADRLTFMETGATFNNNQTISVADLYFDATTNVFDCDGTINISDDLYMKASSNTITGSGTITVSDDIMFNETATLINNFTGTFTVTDVINFSANSCTLTNNQTITVSDDIQFNGTSNVLDNDGTLNISDDILVNTTGASATISGSGNITVTDDFNFSQSGTITNNLTGTFTITDQLRFSTSTATFNNNQTLTISDDIVFQATSVLANAGTINIADDILINSASANVTISGAGTITITDDFWYSTSGTVTNNHTGTFTITDQLRFGAASATFNNNQTLTISDDIRFSSTSATLTNAGTINIADDILVDAASASATISGAGTITVTDDFWYTASGTITNNHTGTFTITDQLRFGGASATLNNNQTLTISDDIRFSSTSSSLVNAGTINIADDILVDAASASATISGAGSITVTDDFTYSASGTITNNLTGTFTITDQLRFDAASATFNNNETLTVSDDIKFGSTLSVLDNDGTINIGDDILMNTASATATIQGTGGINITDDFYYTATATVVNNMTGTLAVGHQFRFVCNSSSFTNAGILTAVDDLVFDGTSNSFTNNGTTTLTDDIRIIDNADDNNSITNGGSSLLNFDRIDCNDADFDFYNSGTVTQTGSFANIVAASAFYNYAGSTWNYNGNGIDTDTRIFANYAANTFSYGRNGNQDVIVAEDNYWHVQFTGTSGTKTLTEANLVAAGDLLIASATAFDSNGNNVSVGGNWDNTSSDGDPFVEGTATVTLNGGSAQTINNGGSNTESFYNLTINNSSGDVSLTANSDVTVNGTLTLTSGDILLSNTNLILGASASESGGGTSSHVVSTGSGVYRKFWSSAGSFTYTLGNSFASTPITITINSATFAGGAYLDGSVTAAVEPNLVSPTDYISRYWTITNSGISTVDYDFSATYLQTDVTGTETEMLAQKYSGSWETYGAVNAATNVLSGTGATSFSTMTASKTTEPLPVELVHFSVQLKDGQPYLSWTTASEINNDYFSVERSVDGFTFENIGQVIGAGNTTDLIDYSYSDFDPEHGLYYYRLKQVDYDGSYEYSEIRSIDLNSSNLAAVAIYPNPNNGQTLYVDFAEYEQRAISISITDVQGAVISEELFSGNQFTIDLSFLNLEAGIYFVQLNNNSMHSTTKLFVR